jgi:UDP-N-acetyl-D-glucosamine/UDP-N-acetyl-D-galactosamine dehydrogenase
LVENTQRYINISLMNEFAQIFDALNMDVKEVLSAACTKWNFHAYYPGLIGGPCLESAAVYLATKAQKQGFEATIIHAAQQRNDDLIPFVVNKLKSINKKKMAA